MTVSNDRLQTAETASEGYEIPTPYDASPTRETPYAASYGVDSGQFGDDSRASDDYGLDTGECRCKMHYMARRQTKQQPTMTELLQRELIECESFRAVETATGVLRQSLMKFARGEQSIMLESADRLAAHFGIKVIPHEQKRK